ncbi:MAG: hypothetical protein RBR35_10610 [Salinivirgaceae bacterium]|nr:hypothetical protein [Salinivirgaceae bacterium]
MILVNKADYSQQYGILAFACFFVRPRASLRIRLWLGLYFGSDTVEFFLTMETSSGVVIWWYNPHMPWFFFLLKIPETIRRSLRHHNVRFSAVPAFLARHAVCKLIKIAEILQ